jgi:hypothetical protein
MPRRTAERRMVKASATNPARQLNLAGPETRNETNGGGAEVVPPLCTSARQNLNFAVSP